MVAGQAGLLAFSAARSSPVIDEPAHVASGLAIWRLSRFGLYKVNPPLVDGVAATPLFFTDAATNWRWYGDDSSFRAEWKVGQDFVAANPDHFGRWFMFARWALIPIVAVGGWVCWRWGCELYGQSSGAVAAVLWCFSPTLLAYGSVVTADASAAATGVLAAYCFWRWLKKPGWTAVFFGGLTLGLAELTKTTWVILFALWPLLWMIWRLAGPSQQSTTQSVASLPGGAADSRRTTAADHEPPAAPKPRFHQLAAILLLGLYALNVGYGFEGSFKRLGDYKFVSVALRGGELKAKFDGVGNRFRGTWLGRLPVPAPENWLSGIDVQKADFEKPNWNYLNGRWKQGGWWYYYIVCAALKVPLGTWVLGILAVALSVWNRKYRVDWQNELVLLLPALAVFVLVSSQTGMNRYFRYVLPCFPFAFIWIGKVGRCVDLKQWPVVAVAGAALCWSVGGSLWVYPHSISYFNELAGGPENGHEHLIDANIDWGQDMFELKKWYDAHPEARPLHLAKFSPLSAEQFGIEARRPPQGPGDGIGFQELVEANREIGPQPGWYALSVHAIHSRTHHYDYFLRFEPVERIGYSIYIYQITPEVANRVRRELGLPAVSPQPVERILQ